MGDKERERERGGLDVKNKYIKEGGTEGRKEKDRWIKNRDKERRGGEDKSEKTE